MRVANSMTMCYSQSCDDELLLQVAIFLLFKVCSVLQLRHRLFSIVENLFCKFAWTVISALVLEIFKRKPSAMQA